MGSAYWDLVRQLVACNAELRRMEERMQEQHRELERRALMQRTCKVCGCLASPRMRVEDVPQGQHVWVEYTCECGASWTAPPLYEQPTERTK